MPTAAVYVPARRWRELSARERDPAGHVRAHVRDWLDGESEEAERTLRAPASSTPRPRTPLDREVRA